MFPKIGDILYLRISGQDWQTAGCLPGNKCIAYFSENAFLRLRSH